MSAFEELGICPDIIQAIEEDEWLLPTAVQQEAVPLILTGQDVLVASETGSGKTGAFGLPCMQIVHENLRGKCQTRDETGSNLRCELNHGDKDMSVSVTEDGLECRSANDKKWFGVRATFEVLKGKYMYEVEMVEGMLRVGWSSSSAVLELGMEEQSFGFGSTGKKSWNRKFDDYGESFQEGDVIGCLLDRELQSISYFKNGRDLGIAFKLPPEFEDVGLKPHVCGKGFVAACKFDGPLEYPVEQHAPIGELDPSHGSQRKSIPKGKRLPMCMILEPTRDLAEQTFKCITKFSKYLIDPKVKTSLFVGGMAEAEQLRQLEDGVDICVGTLQKTMDYVRREKLDVSQIKFLVLDEADDLQKKDDRKDIPQLNAQIKRGRKDRVQTLFFSATLHTPEVLDMIQEITENATWVDLKGKDAVPETVHHVVYFIDPTESLPWTNEQVAVHAKNPEAKPIVDGIHEKPTMSDIDKEHPHALKMSESIKQMKPKVIVKIADLFKMSQCLIFCRTNVDCNNLETYFNTLGGSRGFGGKFESGKENPYSCVVLGGARSQRERAANLESFKDGDVRFLICTDVAARGLDVSGLPYVIQATLSDDIENYVHRIGRCGRNEKLGLAISLVATKREKVWYHKGPSRGKPWNTKLTIPNGPDGKPKPADESKLLVEEGGSTTWYDEPELLQLVEKRIGRSALVMDPEDFSVDGVVESPLGEASKKKRDGEASKEPLSRRAAKRKLEDPQVAVYGAKRNDAKSVQNTKHLMTIAPSVTELTFLETQVQQLFTNALYGLRGMEVDDTPMAAPAAEPTAMKVDAVSGEAAPAPKKKKVRW